MKRAAEGNFTIAVRGRPAKIGIEKKGQNKFRRFWNVPYKVFLNFTVSQYMASL